MKHETLTQARPATGELRRCRCCRRALPAEDFYFRKSKNSHDPYCKECRKAYNRLRRKMQTVGDLLSAEAQAPPETGSEPQTAAQVEGQAAGPSGQQTEQHPERLILTDLPPGPLRHELLHRALEVVRESVRRKRERMKEEELQMFDLRFLISDS